MSDMKVTASTPLQAPLAGIKDSAHRLQKAASDVVQAGLEVEISTDSPTLDDAAVDMMEAANAFKANARTAKRTNETFNTLLDVVHPKRD